MENKIKLFISYSHKDGSYLVDFLKHIKPLENDNLVEIWYDGKILPGKNINNEIEKKFESSDIICLFISKNFIFSKVCQEEKEKALNLEKEKGIEVIPIILSPCAWKDFLGVYSNKLALPTDAKPVNDFENTDKAWLNVYNSLKTLIEYKIKLQQLKIKKKFDEFLQDTEILSKAHPQKEIVRVDDIFIHFELSEYDNSREFKRKINSRKILENFYDYKKIVIAGEGQSGKTMFCKILFKDLFKKNFIPIYIIENKSYTSINDKILANKFEEQYEGFPFEKINLERIVPIIDNFHLSKYKGKNIKYLSRYAFCVLVIDDIFSLNLKDENMISSYTYFKINELKPTLRYELIKKWANLKDPGKREIELYKQIDHKWEIIEHTLGKVFGKGIMPAYPFFILTAIKTYETSLPINQEITSLGYCYQALIYFYLIKQGVKNDEIDIYLNFLTELSYYFFKSNQSELSMQEIDKFINYYKNKFIFPTKKEIVLKILDTIIFMDSFGNYSFRYPYIYYFFLSKYLADNSGNKEIWKRIENIMQNLHVDENAYIAIFLVHHTKDIKILDELELNAMSLFNKYRPASLTKDEIKFFDEQVNNIIKASLPPSNVTPEKTRHNILEIQDKEEECKGKKEDIDENPLENDLRRAIRTVEVIGAILKNRGGALQKTKSEELFEEAMNIHLKILSSFFDIIKEEDSQTAMVEMISKFLEEVIAEKGKKISKEELENIARKIFWNLNFFVVYHIITKTAHSLGSDKLIEIVENVQKKSDNPATFLIKEKISMWYLKNLKINEIIKRMKGNDFSYIAKRVMKIMIANHCALHPVSYKDKQKIENMLGIPKKYLFKKD